MAYLTRDLFTLRSKSEFTLVDERMAAATTTKVVPVETILISDHYQTSSDDVLPIRTKKGIFSRITRKKQCRPATSEATSIREAQRPVTAPRTSTGHTEPADVLDGYNTKVEHLRKTEYPDLEGRAYLDNAGTQLPPKSLLDSFACDLSSRLYGNPHTHSLPARNSAATVAEVRARALDFFQADPEEFDLVFVANATAAIKIVGESIKDYVNAHNATCSRSKRLSLSYAYHKDAHNSLIGCREYASDACHQCFASHAEVEEWLASPKVTKNNLTLFSYPGQSNMTGERLPTAWLKAAKNKPNTYTLFDAAALSTTSQIDLKSWAPDFTALSFYKIFGFPDMGALIVRKSAAHLLMRKKYFAGGTVDGVSVFGDEPMMVRRESVHEVLEEGTLPFHSIIALGNAMNVHARLFGSMESVSKHTKALRRYCFQQLRTMSYAGTGQKLCEIYSVDTLSDQRSSRHGATIALNLYKADGSKIPYRTVERAADAAGIFVRSGAMCNPGGMATHLGWSHQDLEKLFKAGMRCSKPIEIYDNKWSGVVRVSFGAASVKEDADRLITFLKEEYLDKSED